MATEITQEMYCEILKARKMINDERRNLALLELSINSENNNNFDELKQKLHNLTYQLKVLDSKLVEYEF